MKTKTVEERRSAGGYCPVFGQAHADTSPICTLCGAAHPALNQRCAYMTTHPWMVTQYDEGRLLIKEINSALNKLAVEAKK
jgi:hypothetical protein